MTQDQWAEFVKAIHDLGNPNVADWISAIAAALTAVVAVVAAIYARGQLREASQARALTKQLEREKAQPYVVAFMAEASLGPEAMDLVVRNYGQTAARDVRVSFEPGLHRAFHDQDVYIPEVIPFLAPGQEWRTLLDFSRPRMSRKDLDQRSEGTVRYLGLDGEKRDSKCIIDWSTYKDKVWAQAHGIHELAKAGMDIRDQIKGWTEGINDGVSVFVRSGHRKDAEFERRFREVAEEDAEPGEPGGDED